jgi:hypothetical protein
MGSSKIAAPPMYALVFGWAAKGCGMGLVMELCNKSHHQANGDCPMELNGDSPGSDIVGELMEPSSANAEVEEAPPELLGEVISIMGEKHGRTGIGMGPSRKPESWPGKFEVLTGTWGVAAMCDTGSSSIHSVKS